MEVNGKYWFLCMLDLVGGGGGGGYFNLTIIIIIIIIVPFSFPEQLLRSNTGQCTVFLKIQNKQTRIQ